MGSTIPTYIIHPPVLRTERLPGTREPQIAHPTGRAPSPGSEKHRKIQYHTNNLSCRPSPGHAYPRLHRCGPGPPHARAQTPQPQRHRRLLTPATTPAPPNSNRDPTNAAHYDNNPTQCPTSQPALTPTRRIILHPKLAFHLSTYPIHIHPLNYHTNWAHKQD